MKNKKNISSDYANIIKQLDDDDFFITCFYLIPFSLLSYLVPKEYLVRRTEYLKKVGKLK